MGKNMIMTEEGALQFRKVLELINNSLAELMNVADEMIPEKLISYGLKDFLTEYCSLLEIESNLKIALTFPPNWLRQPETLETDVYRIIRTLISFSLRNPKSSVLNIDFEKQEMAFAIHLTDNSRTFENLNETESRLIQSLIEKSGGKLIRDPLKNDEVFIHFEVGKGNSSEPK